MFNFFGKKKQSRIVVDKIWLSEVNKWQALVNEVRKEKDTIIALWFDETVHKLETVFSAQGLPTDKIFAVRELARNYIENNSLIFAEHYPLLSKEQELYEKLDLSHVTVYSSLDEPLLTHFGGNKIIDLVKQMGMKEDEALENPLITSAINKAQAKINKQVSFDQSAHSQADWFRINLPAR
jgi:hypothetical protein